VALARYHHAKSPGRSLYSKGFITIRKALADC
jgi:hypothetical protein